MPRKTKRIAEFGDFQTPEALAAEVCKLLARRRVRPASIVEPTCGRASFLCAALRQFPRAQKAIGLEIHGAHVQAAKEACHQFEAKTRIIHADFFQTDWPALFARLPEPILVVGNPPWITNSELGVLASSNLPKKSNFLKFNGFDAITGKANFDISEWMWIKLLEWLDGRRATVAMLCKTSVARKTLSNAWSQGRSLQKAELHHIDALRSFEAAVNACLLVCQISRSSQGRVCPVFPGLEDSAETSVLGYRDGRLLANVTSYERLGHLKGDAAGPRWRSGVKHDCSKVMEFKKEGKRFRNGLGEFVELENKYLFPMLKSSELANGKTARPTRYMLVTQRNTGEDTATIQHHAPRTWEYLASHAPSLDKRGSSIYRNRPRYSVFGVGGYTFSPWKVAISGFYKRLAFSTFGSFDGKPVVLDDTCYFLPCYARSDAQFVCSLLNSETAKDFFSAFIFWDAKRPITAAVLSQLNLLALAKENGAEERMESIATRAKQNGIT